MPPKMQPAARHADDILEGTLKHMLRFWRRQGRSWQDITRLLSVATEGKVAVTDQTVANWAARLGVK